MLHAAQACNLGPQENLNLDMFYQRASAPWDCCMACTKGCCLTRSWLRLVRAAGASGQSWLEASAGQRERVALPAQVLLAGNVGPPGCSHVT